MTTPIALTIAGSDSSGGAGIQPTSRPLPRSASLRLRHHGADGADTQGVSGIHQVPAIS